ncbi:MAG: hypothetical protein HUK23_03205 [Sphaerochaetaceae bacterium]|nr:hypothetical protein [Sphaerochaetaceae bacterium]
MKKSLLVFLFIVSIFPCGFCTQRLGFGLDLAAVQDLLTGQGSYQLGLDLRATGSDEFQLRVPIACTFNGFSTFVETGALLVYYPWGNGPFMGLSLFQAGFSSGSGNLPNMVTLNEVHLGWCFEFGPGLFIEPSLIIRDPSGTFTDEYSSLKGEYPCYTTFRGKLTFGWNFWSKNETQDKT